jgi:hypothetical protein
LLTLNVKKTYSITKGLGLFLIDYNLHFGVRHQPRHLTGHVYVNLIPTLQKVKKILPNPRLERRSALTLALRQTFAASMIFNYIRKPFHDIGMLGHGQPLHQGIGI